MTQRKLKSMALSHDVFCFNLIRGELKRDVETINFENTFQFNNQRVTNSLMVFEGSLDLSPTYFRSLLMLVLS